MARKTAQSRKTEHLGIPMDEPSKRRLIAIAQRKQRTHTDLAREYVLRGVERDEKALDAVK